MDPVTLATVATVGSKVASGLGDIASSGQQARAIEARQKAGAIKADETEAASKIDLTRQISNIRAIRASAGMVDSPTSDALIDREEQLGDQRMQRIRANTQIQDSQDNMDVGMLKSMQFFGAVGDGLGAFAAGQKV